jgi:serine/threonine protein kinase/Flp pilus assembly protein TadD
VTGRTLSHYRILEEIGRGGMGVVYRARDERLEKDVAIKVLAPGTLADEASRKRFRREALALAKLNHPNITTVHDFDTRDGIDFLVMEYIPGAVLSEKLAAGPLPEKDVIRLGRQLADGLAAAHEQGLIHRDLKPGNLRLTTDSRLKILDFGLAKLLQRDADKTVDSQLTLIPEGAGTLPYMAPEQLRGETTDARTDIFAAGIVLYEMATGQRPFRETSGVLLSDSIQHRAPEKARKINPRISAALDRTIARALAKDPARRHQSAKELWVELERMALSSSARRAPAPRPCGKVAGRIKAIAVLPLENLAGDPAQDYFADGMTDALISSLASIGALRVISRTSAMAYKGVRKPLPQIARELNVDAVVEGSVIRSAQRVRITAALIHAVTDQRLWAESYERNLTDVLALQSDVATAIAEGVRLKVTTKQGAGLKKHPRLNPAAYEAYLKGRYQWNKRGGEGLQKAIQYFEEALRNDALYAPAHAGLADTYALLGTIPYDAMPPTEAMPKAKAAAAKALEIDASLAEAHASLAYVHFAYDWDFQEAEREFQRALAINPGYATAHQWYALFLTSMGRLPQAFAEIKHAQEVDPLSSVINMTAALIWNFTRQPERAIEECRKVLELNPGFPLAHSEWGRACEELGAYDQARSECEQARRLSGDAPQTIAATGHALALLGRQDEAKQVLAELLEMAKVRYLPALYPAALLTALGETDEAFRWLEKAFADRSDYLVYLGREPAFDKLRADPRFKDLVRRIGLPQ